MRWAVAFCLVAVATAVVARAAPDLSLAGPSAATLAFELLAASLLAAAATIVGRAAATVAAAAWLAAEWASPGAGALFTAGLLLGAAWPVVVAVAVARPRNVLVVGGAIITLGVLGLLSTLASDPRATGCSACPPNALAVMDAPAVAKALGQIGLAAAVAWGAAWVVAAAYSIARSTPARRWAEAPALVPASIAIGLFAADAAHGLGRGFLGADPTDRALRAAQALALAALAGGLLAERLRLRRTRRLVAQLVLDIGAAPVPGELRARLASRLGDRDLELLHPVDGAWLDSSGRRVTPDAGAGERTVTELRVAGEPVLAVVHRPGLLDDPQLVDELATTARLAIDHERLQAAHRARLDELRASRERIVAAADRERRRLERDLHDGAQQRLVTLALAIRLARRQAAEGDDAALAAAEEHVRAATAELRELAHGLFPTVLADEGLGPALDVLSEQTPRLVARLPDRRFPQPVESAAYFAAREALAITEHEVTLDGVAEAGRLRLRIAVDGTLDGAITRIEDRVGAAGGRLDTSDGELVLELPCES